MLGYYLRLAAKSFARTPGLTAIMVAAIGTGIAVCVGTLTVYHAMSGNPIWWKSDRLYAVTLDSWSALRPYDPDRPRLGPPQVTYRDAMALFASPIAQRKVIMYGRQLVMSGGPAHPRPLQSAVRVTSADFFAMFEVPFVYGGGWSAAADTTAQPLVVLSARQNNRLFGGVNSIGRTVRLGDRDFQVIGVLDTWHPLPKFYDLNGNAFDGPEDAFIPFGWTTVLGVQPHGGPIACWGNWVISTFQDFLASECVWLQMWVELPDRVSRGRMQVFMDQYWAAQHGAGRFPRPRDNRLSSVGTWLHERGAVSNDSRILVAVAFAFLAVALINTAGLLLARFLVCAPVTGVRRALGASRRQIFLQHLVEAGLIATAGAGLGLGLAALGLAAVRARLAAVAAGPGAPEGLDAYRLLTRLDTAGILWAIGLALLSTLAAGVYPAWRAGRLPPSRYLKSL
jgi:putative ABC transport system permease protein